MSVAFDHFCTAVVVVSCYNFCSVFLCLSYEAKTVSVEEGTDVTLQTDIKVHRNDKIVWMFGDKGPTIATMAGLIKKYDGPDEIFSETLELDENTGSLTIKNIRKEHAGFYELKIQRDNNSFSFKSFKLTVFGE